MTLSTIGFVGLGLIYPGQAEWGSMMSYYQNAGLITALPWTVLVPGAAIFITVLAFSLLGDGLRDILDPRESSGPRGNRIRGDHGRRPAPNRRCPIAASQTDLHGGSEAPTVT